jgi:hypothetical protein
VRYLFYERVRQRKSQRGQKHRANALGQKSVVVVQWAGLVVLDFEEHPQLSAQSDFRENERTFFQMTKPA